MYRSMISRPPEIKMKLEMEATDMEINRSTTSYRIVTKRLVSFRLFTPHEY